MDLAIIAMPLFAGCDYVYLVIGNTSANGHFPFRYSFQGDWQQDPEGASRKVCDLIEHEALPEIIDLTTPEAVAAQQGYGGNLEDRILGPCFNGDYDEAERAAAAYLEHWRGVVWKPGPLPSNKELNKLTSYKPEYEVFSTDLATEEHKFSEVRQWRMTYLKKLLQTDRSRIPALLHEWEAFTVNALGLNKYWTRTPFPCEG